MANFPYNDLGSLYNATGTIEIPTNGLSVLEIVPDEFSSVLYDDDLQLDTFTTNLLGVPTPTLCTGMISWISNEPCGAPINYGLLAGNVNVTTSGKIDLNWALSTDPANVSTSDGLGNVFYDVDYILEYPDGTAPPGTPETKFYLNIGYVNENCLANANCNVSVPTENIYTGDCGSSTSTWIGIQTKGSKHCASYPGQINYGNVSLGNVTTWNSSTSVYYPYGSSTANATIPGNTTVSYELDISALGTTIYEGSIYTSSTAETLIWLSETSGGDPISTTNGCDAKKIASAKGAQFTIKKNGNLTNRDINLNNLGGSSLFINIQSVIEDSFVKSNTLKIELEEVLEDNANVNYNAPLKSRLEVTPIGVASGINTVIDFPEPGEYIVSAQFTDDTGATYQQTKTVKVDTTTEKGTLKAQPRDPNYSVSQTITKGFLGYGPGYQCEPGRYGNNPIYKVVGTNFSYNGINYNMTQNMAQCLAFNCLDNCLGSNLTRLGPNGLLSRGTVDTCEANYYGTTQGAGNVINWNKTSFTDVFADVPANILYYPLVIPTTDLSGTQTVHGQLEVLGNNVLIWISTEPGGGPNNCYGFLESYANYYSMNGQIKFYATQNNGIMDQFSKSHAQLEMGHTYYINIARVSGNIQNFLKGNDLTFVRNKDLTVMFNGMSSWNYKESVSTSPAIGINTSPIVDGTTASNLSVAQEVLPVSFSTDENYGICAETWDSGETLVDQVRIAPNSRVSMPFTTTTRMYKGEFLFTTNDKPFSGYENIVVYITDAPQKTLQSAYGKVVRGSSNAQGGLDVAYNIEVNVANYTATKSSDAVLEKFTTYYLVVENNTSTTFSCDRKLTMVYDQAYGLPNTNYSLYPPWCINSKKLNVSGSATPAPQIGVPAPTIKLGADVHCSFVDNQTFNYYSLGQTFTIKGVNVICNNIIATCLADKPNPTVQDVLRCAGINHDSLNPDTPFADPSNMGGLPKNADNKNNLYGPDPEILTYTTGGGMNVFSSSTGGTTVLSGGATMVDPLVRDAINNSDFSGFNLNGLKNTAFTGDVLGVNWQDYLSQFQKYGNYTSFSNYPLTGDADLIPSSFRMKKRKVKNPNAYGFEVPLKDGRFVNATSQRVTGGAVKALAQPLKIIPRIPRAIKTFNVRDEAYGKVIPSNINQTYRNTYYNPRSIGAYFSTKGRQITNIGDTGFISNPSDLNVPGGAFTASSGANESIPGRDPRLARTVDDTATGEDFFLPDDQQPVADDINYAPAPRMTMTPLIVDENGDYVPAGPEAPIDLRQPTPTATILESQAARVQDNTELFINERKIVFRYGGSLESIKSQINCGRLGVRAITALDANTGQQSLIISSCDSSPWTVANGCAGGIFQQVGDFHINRGFDQSKSITSVFIPQSQLVDGGNISGNTSVINIPYTDQNFTSTGRLVDINFDKNLYLDPSYPADVENKFAAKNFTDFAVPNTAGIMLPQETISVSSSGKGYRVGDRLRLVGGTPVNTNKGPLTIICIDSAGSGYVDPGEISILIGDGSTPGFGAEAEVYSLDMNGGISEIRMLNYGVGYDPARPPKIRIVDNHSDQAYRNLQIINGLNQFEPVTLYPKDVFRYDYPEITEDIFDDSTVKENYIQVTQTYYRISTATNNESFEFGGTKDTNNCRMYFGGRTVDGNYPTININTGELYGNVVHQKYKAVIGLPRDFTVSRGQYIRISSSNDGANASIVNSLPELLCSDHMIGKDASGNDVAALNMPIVRNRSLLNASTIEAVASEMATGNTTVSVAQPFIPLVNGGDFVPVAPYGIPREEAKVTALVGVDPDKWIKDENNDIIGLDNVDPFVGGYSPLGGPQRVAKFLVTKVDADGGIAGLKLLDRGLYRVFPSDLTFGIPLEYDAELLGAPTATAQIATKAQSNPLSAISLGGVDPVNQNRLYGFNHPEYFDGTNALNNFAKTTQLKDPNLSSEESGTGTAGAKHPDWVIVNEYKQVTTDGKSQYISYWGTPGAYDPTTLVATAAVDVNGEIVPGKFDYTPKILEFETGIDGSPTKIRLPETIAGGQGARVFLTAMDVPDCSEEGTAKQDLGLPDVVRDIDGPKTFVNAANNGLIDVGYQPPDIEWTVDGTGPIANVTLNSIYPGVRFNGLDWFGLPSDDYAVGALCIQATLSSPNLTLTETQNELERIYQSSDVFGVNQATFGLPDPTFSAPFNNTNGELNAAVLSLLCIDSIETDPNSVFGDGPVFATIQELYKYDINNIYGQEVKLQGAKQEVDAFIFESKRFSNLDQLTIESYLLDMQTKAGADIEIPSKLWVDSVTLDDTLANIAVRYPGFTQGGWGYFENNIMTRYQTPLVDTRYIHNSIIYDPQSGARTTDLYPWDPFKGVLPGFIDKEIDYISEQDPVVYNAQRHQFGEKQIGAVWWDTSTIRYQWYEQGTNVERWKNWGRAFPGSTIIICEWVESRAKPQNWNGDGTPRWVDRYITERRWDPVKQEYSFFYYYWVMNRTTVDARLRETRNRQYDTRTIARYLSDPVGFGIHMISFLSSNAVMFSNLSDVLRDSGNHVQINLARDLDPDGIKHTAWKLIREDDENSVIPENITLKLTDSLAGENLVGEPVPDPKLSSVMSYGAKFRPRQGMFVNIKEARRTMAYVLNEIFANLKLYTDFPTWDTKFPATDTWQYLERVNYYAVIYTDENTNEPVRYDDSYKPIFNVATISDLNSLTNLPDGTVVQVAGTELAEPQLWIYNIESNDFSQIAILNDTIRFKDTVFTDDTNSQMSLEIRNVLNLFNDDLFQRFNFWNILFFEMLKYAYMEQRQLDWAFKTTYLYVEKEEEDLIQISGFKPDNYQAILDYMDEAKPYSSKVREYRDGKSPPMEIIGTIQPDDGIPGDGEYDDISSGVPGIPGLPGPGDNEISNELPGDTNPNAGLRSVSDYDKPPYPDPNTGTIRILDDFNQSDREIMATNPDYVNYFSITNKADDPIRHNNINLTYDRTNWRFTEYLWNANTTPLEQSITNNIVHLTTQTVKEVAANANVRAIDRIFKFDPVVINQFNRDIVNNYAVFSSAYTYPEGTYIRRQNETLRATFDLYKSNKIVTAGTGWKTTDWDLQEAPYTDIVTNVDIVYDIVESGNLNFTLALLKNKVGGDWQGETLDANVFTKVVPGADPTYDYQTQFGYGTEDYEEFYWDVVTAVNNYVGIFKPPPEVNLRRNDRDYDGFDGISFLRVLYGEERPEELVQVDPYETFIINCVTNTETARIPIGAEDVWYNPRTGLNESGINGNIVIVGGSITEVNLSDDLIDRSYGTCRAISIEAIDTTEAGANAEFRLNLQTPPVGWPGGATWPQIESMEVLNGGSGYNPDTTTVWLTVALQKNANPVQFQIFESLFGQTDYGRVRERTTLKEDLFTWSDQIIVNEPKLLPDPLPGKPGYLWIDGSEYVKYERKDNTTGIITQFQRGAEGTTIQDWAANVEVWDGSIEQKFNDIDPWRNIWLDQGYRYQQLYNWDDNNYEDNDTPGNVYVMMNELANANIVYENNIDVIVSEVIGANTGTGWQPGWDYGNIQQLTCNVSSISFIEQGKARFELDCAVPRILGFCQITTDFSQGDIDFVIDDSPFGNVIVLEDPLSNTSIIAERLSGGGNSNTISNVMLVPAGNDSYNAFATVRSNTWVSGTCTGNISITENYTPVLEPNANITGFASIAGMDVYEVANTINSFNLPTVSARVDDVWMGAPAARRQYLRITGRYFTINEIDTPALHIEPGTYLAEWFEYDRFTTNTIIIEDDLWTSETLVEGMSNTLVTFNIDLNNIPWDYANAIGFPALSLADLANTDSTDNNSIMKFLHGVETPETEV